MADLSVQTQDWIAAWDSADPPRQYVQRYAAGSATWTAPTGVTAVQVELWGGGGCGGTAQGNPSFAGGGAGGQYVRTPAYAVTPGTDYPLVVAALKTSVVNTITAGNDSTFNTTGVVAKGGAGAANASGGTGAGRAGSLVGGVGTVVYAGGGGGSGVAATVSGGGGGGAGSTGTGQTGTGGTPGGSTSEEGGSGGLGVSASAARNAGTVYGGGGSGGCARVSTNQRGGDGAAGLGRLTWTLPVALASTLALEAVALSDTVTVTVDCAPVQAVETVTLSEDARGRVALGTVELREGSTTRATRTLDGLTTSWATFEFSLTDSERNAITDWSALRVALLADLQPIEVSWIQLQAPESERFDATVSETLTLSETGTRAACDERALASDTVTVGEVGPPVVTRDVAVTTTDAVTLSDLAEVARVLTADVSETVTVSEAPPLTMRLDYEGEAIPCFVSETVATLSDSGAGALTPLETGATDTVTLSETAGARLALLLGAGSDTLTLSETDTRAASDLEVGAGDTLTVATAGAPVLTPEEAALSDTLTWGETGTDALRVEAEDLGRLVADTVTVTETWVSLDVELRQGATVIARRRLDTLTTAWATTDLTLTSSEQSAITDWSALRVALVATGRQAQVSWLQVVVPLVPDTTHVAPLPDDLTLSDAGTATCDLNVRASEALTLSDTRWVTMRPGIRVFSILFSVPLLPSVPLEAQGEEDLLVWEQFLPPPFYGSGWHYVTLTDQAAGRLDLLAWAVTPETVTLSDAATAWSDLNATGTETVTLADPVVAEATLDAEVSETLTVGETGTDATLPDMGTWQEEPVTLTVAVQAALDPLPASIADQGGLTLTDAGSGVLDPLRASTSETIALGEEATATSGLEVQDALTLSEGGQVEYWQGIRVTDHLTIDRVRPYAPGDLWVDEWLALENPVEAAIDRLDARVADGVFVEDRPNGETTGPYLETRPAEALALGSGGQVETWRGIVLTDQAEAVRLSDTLFGGGDVWVTLSDDAWGERPDLHVQDALTWSEGGVVDWYDITVPVTLTEVLRVVLTPLEAAGSDPLSLSDVGDGQMVDLAVGRQDGLTMSDDADGAVEPVVVAVDVVAVLEAPPRVQRVELHVFDGAGVERVTLGEDVVAQVATDAARTDEVTLSEAVAAVVDPLETAASETSLLSDPAAGVVDPERVEVADTLTLDDEAFRVNAAESETLTLSETVTVTRETVAAVEVPGSRVWRVPADGRTWRVEASDRTWTVAAEPRTWRVPAEDRTWRSETDDD